MGMTSSINGNTVTKATLWRSDWGTWYADVETDKPVALAGAAALVLADLTLSGTVLSGGAFSDRSRFRVVGGAGGWGKIIPAKSYSNDVGVKVSQVVSDAASACGETVQLTTTDKVGRSWTYDDDGPAVRVLERVARGAWYVDEAGITKLGKRPRTTLTEKVTVQNVDVARSIVSVASDKIAALAPGVTVEGIEAIDCIHELTDKSVRTTLYGKRGTSGSRAHRAFTALLDLLDPDRKFRGLFEYRVVQQDGDTLDLQIVRKSTGMPDLRRVPVRPGTPGCSAEFTPGSRVVVGFVDSSPSGAFVLAGDEVGSAGFLPLELKLDATTFVKLGAGIKPVGVFGDVGNPTIATTQTKVLA